MNTIYTWWYRIKNKPSRNIDILNTSAYAERLSKMMTGAFHYSYMLYKRLALKKVKKQR